MLCDGTPVERKSFVKYLGVMLDENINGSVHARNLMKVWHFYIVVLVFLIGNVARCYVLLLSNLISIIVVAPGIAALLLL